MLGAVAPDVEDRDVFQHLPSRHLGSRRAIISALAAVLAAACGAPAGELELLSYNIHGLPFSSDTQDPAVNVPKIAPRLVPYSLVLLQEDFTHHDALLRAGTHDFVSEPGVPSTALNDGLTFMSRQPFSRLERVKWSVCHGVTDSGSDCFADKGYAVARFRIDDVVELDVYNLHMDAGRSAEDHAARAAQIEQLVSGVAARSGERAVVIAGDTNLKPDSSVEDAALLEELVSGLGLTDVCRALSCGDEARIDRVLFRSGERLTLTPRVWRLEPGFADESGQPLSDHEPVFASFTWERESP